MTLPRPRVGTQRYEHKYLVDEAQARRIRARAAMWVEPDPIARRDAANTYPVASLYFDAGDLVLYRETVEGLRSRYKLRVRTYSDAPDAPVFFEIKRRHAGIVEKTRCAVSREQAWAMLDGAAVGSTGLDRERHRVCDEFFHLATCIGARPRVVVRYDREAWVGMRDPQIRVTFDRQLRTARTDEARVAVERDDFVLVEGQRVVVEFKFNGRVPAWIAAICRDLELRRRSFSKYGHAVETCALPGLVDSA